MKTSHWQDIERPKWRSFDLAPDGSSALVSTIVHVAPLGRIYYCVTKDGKLPNTKFTCMHCVDDVQYDAATRTWSGLRPASQRRYNEEWVISVGAGTVTFGRILPCDLLARELAEAALGKPKSGSRRESGQLALYVGKIRRG